MTTLIVLDTTETFGDLRLEGPDFAFLRSYISLHPVTLVVPQIVVEETINHFREQLEEAIAKAKLSLRAVGRLVPLLTEKIDLDCDLEYEVARFRELLLKRLSFPPVKQPSYESVSLSSLVGRALSRRKPFDPKGSTGFRDAVLWESLLTYVVHEGSTEVILITRNKRDFGEHGGLAEDLVADVTSRGLPQGVVTVCEGLQRFVNEQVKPSLETLKEISRKLDEGEFEAFDPSVFIEENAEGIHDELEKRLKRMDFDRLTAPCVWHYSCPSLGRIAVHPDQYSVADVWRISATELGIGIDFEIPGSINCQREVPTEPYGEPFDEYFDGKVRFKLSMTLVFDERSKEVGSWEVNDLDVELTGDWGFPELD